MDRIVHEGGRRLSGEVPISGAKNAALPIMAACLLTDKPCVLKGVPDLMDIRTMGRLLGHLGVVRGQDPWAETLTLEGKDLASTDASYELVKTMRASVLVLGPLVARAKQARVSLPLRIDVGIGR